MSLPIFSIDQIPDSMLERCHLPNHRVRLLVLGFLRRFCTYPFQGTEGRPRVSSLRQRRRFNHPHPTHSQYCISRHPFGESIYGPLVEGLGLGQDRKEDEQSQMSLHGRAPEWQKAVPDVGARGA